MPTVAKSSMSSRAGPRGTAGFLTMAPEIFQGREPTQKSDMFSFGGMVFEALRPKLAVQWSHPLSHDRYDDSGRFRLPALASDAAEETVDLGDIKTEVDCFVSALMHKDPRHRPTATLALEDPLFFRNQGLGEEYAARLDECEKERLKLQRLESEFFEMVQRREKELGEQEAKCKEDSDALRREREQIEVKYQKPRQTLLEKDKRLDDELQGLAAKREEVSLQQQQERDALQSRASELELESKQLSDQSSSVGAKLLDLETQTRALEQDKQKLESEIQSARLHLQHQEAAVIKQRADMELQQQADSTVKRRLQEEEDRLREEKRKQEAEFEGKLASLQETMSEESARRRSEEQRLRAEQARIEEQRRGVERKLEEERRAIERERLALDNEVQQLVRKQRGIERQRAELLKQESSLSAAELLARRRQEKAAAELRARTQELRAKRVAEEERLSLQRVELESMADEMKRQRAEIAKHARLPDHWQETTRFNLARNDYMKPFMQQWLRASDCGAACGHNLRNLRVTRVMRIENAPLWSCYVSTKEMLQKVLRRHTAAMPKLRGHVHTASPVPPFPVLDSSVNEFLAFHGTSQGNILKIAEFGCDHRVAKLEGLYGGGSYFADQACKSCQYNSATAAVESAILVCRVMMGWPHLTTNPAGEKSLRRPPDNPATPGRCFDSIFAQKGKARGGGQAHNELVVFDRGQIYVEYIVYFTM